MPPLADVILRSAFDTFTGVASLFGDRDYVRTRWLADPGAAFAAERDGQLVGTNLVTSWGTVGFVRPLSVRPGLWDQGVANRLMEAAVALFDRCARHTPASSPLPTAPSISGSTRSSGSGPGS